MHVARPERRTLFPSRKLNPFRILARRRIPVNKVYSGSTGKLILLQKRCREQDKVCGKLADRPSPGMRLQLRISESRTRSI